MKRREFITNSMLAGTWVLSSGLLVSSCRGNLRSELMPPLIDSSINFENIKYMSQEAYKILYYASLAPSGHNSQPWSLRMRWVPGFTISQEMVNMQSL